MPSTPTAAVGVTGRRTTGAAARRRAERVAYDAYLAQCASRQLLGRISDKWVTLVLCALDEDGPSRYSALARRIAGVSQKMLTQTLRTLERDGLVDRTVEPTVPVTVEYALTPLGASLVDVVHSFKQWAEHHVPQIVEARAVYDLR